MLKSRSITVGLGLATLALAGAAVSAPAPDPRTEYETSVKNYVTPALGRYKLNVKVTRMEPVSNYGGFDAKIGGKTYTMVLGACVEKECTAIGNAPEFSVVGEEGILEGIEINGADFAPILAKTTLDKLSFRIDVTEKGKKNYLFSVKIRGDDLLIENYYATLGKSYTSRTSGSTQFDVDWSAELVPSAAKLDSVDVRTQSDLPGDLVLDKVTSLDPRFGQLYAFMDGNGFNTTIKEHSVRVLHRLGSQNACEHYLAAHETTGFGTPNQIDFLKVVLALHDIGKGEAAAHGEKQKQHSYTARHVSTAMKKLGFSPKDIVLANTLIGNDIVGEFLMRGPMNPSLIPRSDNRDSDESDFPQQGGGSDGGSNEVDHAKKKLEDLAAGTGLSPKDYFRLQMLYYTSDAGAYFELVQSGVFRTNKPCWTPRRREFYDLAKAFDWNMDAPPALPVRDKETRQWIITDKAVIYDFRDSDFTDAVRQAYTDKLKSGVLVYGKCKLYSSKDKDKNTFIAFDNGTDRVVDSRWHSKSRTYQDTEIANAFRKAINEGKCEGALTPFENPDLKPQPEPSAAPSAKPSAAPGAAHVEAADGGQNPQPARRDSNGDRRSGDRGPGRRD